MNSNGEWEDIWKKLWPKLKYHSSIEKYKNHRKCTKIVPSDEPCLGMVQDQHFIDLLCLQNITFQPTCHSAACSERF